MLWSKRLFINDLESFLRESRADSICISKKCNADLFLKLLVVLYADDTALLADSPLGLQRCLDGMFEYCKLWQLQVNVEKTKITVFESQKSAAQDAVFRYNGDILEVVL